MNTHAFPDHPQPSARPVADLTVYFDGACPVCSREIAAYRRQRGAERCRWVDASASSDAALGPGLSRERALARFHVRLADGRLVHGMRGFALLWRALPRWAWLGRLASFGPMPVLLDAAYAVFLRVRPMTRRLLPRASRSVACAACTAPRDPPESERQP